MRLIIQALLIISIFASSTLAAEETGEYLELHFIDVGYGDSILIKSPAGGYTLIDTGYPEAAKKLPQYLRGKNITTLDYLIMSHPHPDHLGGAVEVLNKFKVKHLRDNGQPIDRYDERLTPAIGKEYEIKFRGQQNYQDLTGGDTIRWGEITLEILWPPSPLPSPDWNTNSMVIMLRYQEFRALLTADLNKKGEEDLLTNKGSRLRADLLKVGHHGAGDATGPEFLKAVSPEIAVISVGQNPWGYPSSAVIRRLEEAGAKVFRTDRDGSISFRYTPDEAMGITPSSPPPISIPTSLSSHRDI